MSTDNETQKNPISSFFNWIFKSIEGRLKFVSGAFCLVLAIIALNAAWIELSGKKRSAVRSMTANGVVEVVDSAVWILPENSLEAKLVSGGRMLYKEDITFEYILDRRFNPESRIKSYRSRRHYDYFTPSMFWDTVRDDQYFRCQDFKVLFNTELLQLRQSTPAQSGASFRTLSAPPDAPRDQRSYMGSTFDQFWVHFDWPMHALAMEWLAASGLKEIPVRYNPDNPEDFLDEPTYQRAVKLSSPVYSIFPGGALFVFGMIALIISFTQFATGMNKTYQVMIFILIIFAIPLCSPYVKTIMDYVGIPKLGKLIVQDIADSMDVRRQVGFFEEMKEDKSEYTIFTIDAPHSRYKDIYGHFKLSPTFEKYKSFAAAMQDISSQITSQLNTFSTKDLFQFYRVLSAHMSQQRMGWDAPLLESTKKMAVDTSRSANLRSWVISVLREMCYALDDPEFAEFMYNQYISSDEDVKKYWRRNMNFYQSRSFKEDINSSEPDRIKRALNAWMQKHLFKEKIQFLVPRLKTLTQHPDPEIRELARTKWDSRKDLGDR